MSLAVDGAATQEIANRSPPKKFSLSPGFSEATAEHACIMTRANFNNWRCEFYDNRLNVASADPGFEPSPNETFASRAFFTPRLTRGSILHTDVSFHLELFAQPRDPHHAELSARPARLN
jgi:hypothetical protein